MVAPWVRQAIVAAMLSGMRVHRSFDSGECLFATAIRQPVEHGDEFLLARTRRAKAAFGRSRRGEVPSNARLSVHVGPRGRAASAR
jgi:hypothetical protein